MPKPYRPRQNRNANDKARLAIQRRLPDLVNVLMTAALGGDIQAAKLLLDRALPALKPEAAPKPLAFLADGVTADAITQAVARGELTPEQASALMSLAPKAEADNTIIIERTYGDLPETLARLRASGDT